MQQFARARFGLVQNAVLGRGAHAGAVTPFVSGERAAIGVAERDPGLLRFLQFGFPSGGVFRIRAFDALDGAAIDVVELGIGGVGEFFKASRLRDGCQLVTYRRRGRLLRGTW